MMNEIELYDLYDIWYIPAWYVKYRYQIGALLGLGLLLFLLMYFYKKRVKNNQALWDQAISHIENLELKKFEKPEEIYCSMTGIFKNYMQNRYFLDLQGKTDNEMLEIISSHNDKINGIHEELIELYKGLPLIKFAQSKKSIDLIKQDLDRMVVIIKKTIPNKETPS